MKEGKELLQSILESKMQSIDILDKNEFYIDGINLADILASLEENIDNFYAVTDAIIHRVAEACKQQKIPSFSKKLMQIRDLLIGKHDYKLNVVLTQENQALVNIFIAELKNILNIKQTDAVNLEDTEATCKRLSRKIANKEIIEDFDFIEQLVREYNTLEFDNNMFIIMKFINKHNLTILKMPKRTAPLFDIRYIIKPKLDERIKEILAKLETSQKDLPNYLLAEFKKSKVEDIYETFNLLKKNKAENYGILHLVRKENLLAKLILILYATPTSIQGVVDSVKDTNGKIDINLLKIIVNTIPTCFLSKSNEYFKPKYNDYIKNITLLKELNVNYKAVINRTPLFMVLNNEILNCTLNSLAQYGADKKTIINKCYKTLAINPSLLLDNLNILKVYKIDMNIFFAQERNNYNLLKVSHLEEKLKTIINENHLDNAPLNSAIINKLLIGKVYREVVSEEEGSK